MSAVHAQARVAPRPHEEPAPYIEIAPTRQQRRSRPRLAYAMVVVGGLFAVLVSQLLLSIALADGAYEIAALQADRKELSRDEQILSEKLDVLNSPQNLAARAESLGMVSNESAVYLSLATGAVLGVPTAASEGAGGVIGENGTLLISNELIGEIPDMGGLLAAESAAAAAAAAAADSAGDAAGVAQPGVADQSVPSFPDGIPAPVTQ
ncbi:hypothetical protein FVA74_05635 [Salinibacterium sp. dk2585]|uniref:hypothetical protein n=1 Tax=unclassified Salinibacterium TaxID=2632331 RepID=UPI0011C24585|nr:MULTISPECIES: hypothetical protein [unclassified Salinibacterium]QEE61112.1 hypothetical protein FVA74_05635 [Salinibacterium sp. dk2585]TXK53055.1 hypothetical protein FVP63_11755 [Salinibacterium sp. dk5596]